MKHCPKCKEYKCLSEFNKDKNRKDGHDYWCKLCCKEKRKNHWNKNKEKLLKQHRLYRIKNRKKLNKKDRKYRKIQRRTNINFRIAGNLRGRINTTIKKNKKSDSFYGLLGCSLDFLKNYLQSQFKSGMSWKNHGYYGWHIDHINLCQI